MSGHFLAIWIESALREGTIKIFGTGEQTVDLIHVSDVTRVMGAFANIANVTPGRTHVYNIGTGVETQVRDVARWFQEEFQELQIQYDVEKASLVRRVAAVDRISADLGFQPQHDTEKSVRHLFRRAMHGDWQ
jgi:nucleoside-diphosphate-sugar epimerase